MKKSMILLFTLISAVSFCGEEKPAEQQRSELNSGSAPKILFLGDSLTAGYKLPVQKAYPALIEKKLKKAGSYLRVINGGRSGDTTEAGLTRLSWYLKPGLNIEYVVISLGSNDAMRGVPLTETEDNLNAIIDRIQKELPGAEVFLVELQTFPNMGSRYGSEFRELFKKVADKQNIKLLPFFLEPVAGKPELNLEDGIHPNVKGTELVAEHLWNSLKKYLIK